MPVDKDMQQRVVAHINNVLGKDVKQLQRAANVAQHYRQQLHDIKHKLNSNESSIKMALDAEQMYAKSIEVEIHKLDGWAEQMRAQIEKFTVLVVDSTNGDLEQVRKLQQMVKYLDIVKEIQNVSKDLQTALEEQDAARLVNICVTLYEPNDSQYSILGRLNSVQAPHLKKFALKITNHWYQQVRLYISAELEATMKSIQWGQKENPLSVEYQPTDEAISKAQMYAEYLFMLNAPNDDYEVPVPIINGLVCQPLSAVTKVLLEPYKQRFNYHFYGTRKTNRLDKPEWFFTQILNWGKQAHLFVGKTFQSAALKAGKLDFNIRLEFMRGLVQLVVEKIANDIETICRDPDLFSHLIDETLAFEMELREIFGYPPSFTSAISVLTQPRYLLKWITIEEAFCERKMDKILQHPNAWTLVDPHVLDDELKIPICVDQFLRLLEAIKQRYFPLVQPGHQLQFLSLQLELLDSFRRRLVQLHSGAIISASSILNAVNYLAMVLREWGENIHYLHLHTALNGQNSTEIHSVFEEPVAELEQWRSIMIENYCTIIISEVKSRSMHYRHDDWASMPDQAAKQPFLLSPSGGEMFHYLLITLHSLHRELSANIFNRLVRFIAHAIDEFLYDSVIMTVKFSSGGAEQFKFDMTRNLFTLFGQYIRCAELLFKKINNSIKLLTAATGTALLLHETLLSSTDIEEKEKTLQELDIIDFTPETCIDVLERRNDIKALHM